MIEITTLIVILIAIFGLSGIIKFTFFTDKTMYIIVGAIILLMLMKGKRK